ncbi:MAG: C40 family peptidase [Lachnospiraceae bacterium]|nr:C40 family peptidase [Lachnospiraceae bacterium]
MKSRLAVLAIIFIFSFSTIARADVIADRPGDVNGASGAGIIDISSGSAASGAVGTNAGSGGTDAAAEIGPVITDAPVPVPSGESSVQIIDISTGAKTTEIPVGPVLTEQTAEAIEQVAETAEQETQKVIVLPEQKNAVIKAAPATGTAADGTNAESAAAQAPATEASGENAGNIELIDGPVSAGPGSQRVSLGFGIVSPAHNMGSQNLAIGSVELADGSWQALGYDACIHAPYYKLIREAVDSLGTSWYIVKYSGNRIGNAHTNDGTKAGEVWLLKADCTAKNYIDIATANSTRGKIVAAALELLGSRYAYGGSGPDSFDCSGLVKYVCDKAGVKVPRTSSELCALPDKVDISKLRPGDICGRNGHVGIYIGNDVFIHASESSVGVVAEYLSSYNAINRFTAYINVVGD